MLERPSCYFFLETISMKRVRLTFSGCWMVGLRQNRTWNTGQERKLIKQRNQSCRWLRWSCLILVPFVHLFFNLLLFLSICLSLTWHPLDLLFSFLSLSTLSLSLASLCPSVNFSFFPSSSSAGSTLQLLRLLQALYKHCMFIVLWACNSMTPHSSLLL